jgi:hypothetical protein
MGYLFTNPGTGQLYEFPASVEAECLENQVHHGHHGTSLLIHSFLNISEPKISKIS